MRPSVALALSLALSSTSAGCFFEYPRELEDAEVRGTVQRADGSAAATAVVSAPGTERVAPLGKNGDLLLKDFVPMTGALRIVVDDDADGVAEEGAYVPFLISLQEVKKNITDGITTQAKEVVNGILLADVTLEETRTVSGTVLEEGQPLAPGRAAHVLVFRTMQIGAFEVVRDATLPVEASAATAGENDGAFSVAGVVPGDVEVIALVGPEGGPFARVAHASVSAGDDDVTLDATLPYGAPMSTQLELVGATERATLDAVELSVPGTGAVAATVDVGEPAGTHVLELVRGVFDVLAFSSAANAGVVHGAAFVGQELPPFTPIELPTDADACGSRDARDCDHDDVIGLPSIEDAGAAEEFDACAVSCSGLAGADLDGATCGGLDCDDDADGVADVDERACVGPLVGTDTDGDGLCEPAADPFPGCAANTIADCL